MAFRARPISGSRVDSGLSRIARRRRMLDTPTAFAAARERGFIIGCGTEQGTDLGIEVRGVMLEMPGDIADHLEQGRLAQVRTHRTAVPILARELHEHRRERLPKGVHRGYTRPGGHEQRGRPGTREPRIEKGVLVPVLKDGAVLGDRPAETHGVQGLDIHQVSQQSTGGPKADPIIG